MTATKIAAPAVEPITLGLVDHSCALVVANDDDTHMDPDDAEMVRATIGAIRRDERAWLTVDDPRDAGVFRCCLCDWDSYGTAYTLLGWPE